MSANVWFFFFSHRQISLEKTSSLFSLCLKAVGTTVTSIYFINFAMEIPELVKGSSFGSEMPPINTTKYHVCASNTALTHKTPHSERKNTALTHKTPHSERITVLLPPRS